MGNMLEGRILITGNGRSGTTFVAHTLYNAGFDFGTQHPSYIGTNIFGGGMELTDVALTNDQDPSKDLPFLELPLVIKDPRMIDPPVMYRWLSRGHIPQVAIFTSRNLHSQVKSLQHYAGGKELEGRELQNYMNKLSRKWYTTLHMVLRHGVRVIVIPFPEVGHSHIISDVCFGQLGVKWHVVKKTFDGQMVHF